MVLEISKSSFFCTNISFSRIVRALFEDFQLHGRVINSVHKLKRSSLKAALEKVVFTIEFCKIETWQDFLSSYSGNSD